MEKLPDTSTKGKLNTFLQLMCFKLQWNFAMLRRLSLKYLLSLYFNGKDVSWDVSLAVAAFESKEMSCRILTGRIPCLGGTHTMCFRTPPYIYGRHAAMAKNKLGQVFWQSGKLILFLFYLQILALTCVFSCEMGETSHE